MTKIIENNLIIYSINGRLVQQIEHLALSNEFLKKRFDPCNSGTPTFVSIMPLKIGRLVQFQLKLPPTAPPRSVEQNPKQQQYHHLQNALEEATSTLLSSALLLTETVILEVSVQRRPRQHFKFPVFVQGNNKMSFWPPSSATDLRDCFTANTSRSLLQRCSSHYVLS